MSIRDRIAKFRDEWQAAGERLDEIHAQRPAPKPRQLTDEETAVIAANAATTANALNTIQQNGD